MLLGGGRASKEDVIDMSAGIVLAHKDGASVKVNDLLCTCYSDKPLTDEIKNMILNAFEF